jgi:hypothetical protein
MFIAYCSQVGTTYSLILVINLGASWHVSGSSVGLMDPRLSMLGISSFRPEQMISRLVPYSYIGSVMSYATFHIAAIGFVMSYATFHIAASPLESCCLG